MKAVSLFSGCGGSDLGAKWAGADVVFANDISRHSAETYRNNRALIASEATDFREGDVRSIKHFPACDLLLGCYPCQSFSMGGPRSPQGDPRTSLYREFFRCLNQTTPKYFVAENVAGMKWLGDGSYLADQIRAFQQAGTGYFVSARMLDAKEYGVPADRKRIFLVGVRRDLEAYYWFPEPSHGPLSKERKPFLSHGDAISHLPLDAESECYQVRTFEESGWYMTRNRRRPWESPSYTIIGNWRHIPLHPASPKMVMTNSDLANGSKQTWEFTDTYDHLEGHPERRALEFPRRLSWRECSVLQTFPEEFVPVGSLQSKYRQIGNAVPPKLMQAIVSQITSGAGLKSERSPDLLSESTSAIAMLTAENVAG